MDCHADLLVAVRGVPGPHPRLGKLAHEQAQLDRLLEPLARRQGAQRRHPHLPRVLGRVRGAHLATVLRPPWSHDPAVLIEGDRDASESLDGFVSGGSGDPRSILGPARPFLATEELLDLVRWLRDHNDRTSGAAHIAVNATRRLLPEASAAVPSAGALLRDRLGPGYRAIGLTFGQGRIPQPVPPPPPYALEAVLDAQPHPTALVMPGLLLDGRAATQIRLVGPGDDPRDDATHAMVGAPPPGSTSSSTRRPPPRARSCAEPTARSGQGAHGRPGRVRGCRPRPGAAPWPPGRAAPCRSPSSRPDRRPTGTRRAG
ncbi:MAG: hypothetical protein GEV08_05905 [Acidimicrobiia bacterium]|nr:hypothetical protein [Acidimicrobiia bacterium]